MDAHFQPLVLREFQPLCTPYPKTLVLHALLHPLSAQQYVERHASDARQSRLFQELANTGLACAGAIGGLLLMWTGGGLSPFTGGVSLVITGAGYAAITASAAQCLIGGTRATLEIKAPHRNDALDKETWYRIVSPLLDAIALLGITGSSVALTRQLVIRKKAPGLGWFDLNTALSRQQRSRLMDEILSIKHPSLSAKQLKLKQRLGALPKRYTPAHVRAHTLTLIGEALSNAIGIVGSGLIQNLALTLIEGVPE